MITTDTLLQKLLLINRFQLNLISHFFLNPNLSKGLSFTGFSFRSLILLALGVGALFFRLEGSRGFEAGFFSLHLSLATAEMPTNPNCLHRFHSTGRFNIIS